jgi:2-hydroxychromene-2-carboxylate isomerase
MPAEPAIEFWFSIASTYTYLSVTRLFAVEREHGCRFVWRPFLLRTIMTEQDNFPFRDKPIKAAYMWRDIERRACDHAIPFRGPVPYPIPGGTSRQSGRHPRCSGGLVCGLRRRDIPPLIHRFSGAGQRTEPQRHAA